jgi:site-specific recombinase XerD
MITNPQKGTDFADRVVLPTHLFHDARRALRVPDYDPAGSPRHGNETITEPLEEWVRAGELYLASLTRGASWISQSSACRRIFRDFDAEHRHMDEVSYQTLIAVKMTWKHGWAPATVRRHLAALVRLFQEARRLGLVSPLQQEVVKSMATGEHPPHRRSGRRLSTDELERLRTVAAARSPTRYVAYALLRLGLRRTEVATVKHGQLVRDAAQQVIAVQLVGKGRRFRQVPVPESLREPMNIAWRLRFGYLVDDPDKTVAQASVLGVKYGQSIEVWVRYLSQLAGITPHVRPHDMRRTIATELLEGGVDLITVRNLLGHSSTDTTALYDYRDENTLARVLSEHVTL